VHPVTACAIISQAVVVVTVLVAGVYRIGCSPLHAVGFAAVTGSVGLLLLASAVNNLTALLAVSNLVIYCALYTPMKRMSTANTSLGAVVGAIPPLIGWAAATGTLHAGHCFTSC